MHINFEQIRGNDSFILKNATYYSSDHRFCKGDIAISNNKIKEILPSNSSNGTNVVDTQNLVIFPGLINSHLHPSKELYGGLEPFSSISEILDTVHKNNHLETKELQRLSSSYSILNSVNQGITTLGIFTSRAEIDAEEAKKFNIRAVIHFAQNDQWVGKESSPTASSIDNIINRYLDCVDNYESDLIKVHPATASELTATSDLMKKLHAMAKEQGKRFAMHISEGSSQVDQCISYYGKSGIQILDEMDLLDDSTLLVHAASLSNEDTAILSNKNLNFIHCPVSNSFVGAGRFPFKSLLHNNVGLGTDAAMVNPFNNLPYEAAFSLYFHGESNLDEKVHPNNIIEAITTKGALALGIDNLGSIEEGMIADLCFFNQDNIFVDSQEPSLLFLDTYLKNKPVHVMVNGEFIILNQKFLNFEFEQVRKEFFVNKRLER
ncbi:MULTISPECIES: amidohydrolase family protein [unclassified Lysinibacillus]|uniref:amidohydrolase family protein n=1 Tax=unclassified Lysinibacillus TaxID=2636778 RepID=UPI00381A3BCE